MRLIRAADCRRMPWKNGGGETVEIATFPEGAGLDDFVWRLSAARVAQDGLFSLFPGIDRTLAILSGEGMALRVGEAMTRLGREDAPLSFPGDQATEARLLGGPVEDLNIMTRRGVVQHAMRRIEVEGPAQVEAKAETVLLFCAAGKIEVDRSQLDRRDTLMSRDAETHSFAVDGLGTLYLIAIDAVRCR